MPNQTNSMDQYGTLGRPGQSQIPADTVNQGGVNNNQTTVTGTRALAAAARNTPGMGEVAEGLTGEKTPTTLATYGCDDGLGEGNTSMLDMTKGDPGFS